MANSNFPDDIRQYDNDYRSPFYEAVNIAECNHCGWEGDYEDTGLCENTGLEQCPSCKHTDIQIHRHTL